MTKRKDGLECPSSNFGNHYQLRVTVSVMLCWTDPEVPLTVMVDVELVGGGGVCVCDKLPALPQPAMYSASSTIASTPRRANRRLRSPVTSTNPNGIPIASNQAASVRGEPCFDSAAV